MFFAPLIMPPPQFDHPFPAHIRWVSRQEMQRHCGRAEACSFRISDKECLIYVYHGSPYGDVKVLRHEMGHCNGWPANHAGGHY